MRCAQNTEPPGVAAPRRHWPPGLAKPPNTSPIASAETSASSPRLLPSTGKKANSPFRSGLRCCRPCRVRIMSDTRSCRLTAPGSGIHTIPASNPQSGRPAATTSPRHSLGARSRPLCAADDRHRLRHRPEPHQTIRHDHIRPGRNRQPVQRGFGPLHRFYRTQPDKTAQGHRQRIAEQWLIPDDQRPRHRPLSAAHRSP